MSADCVHELHQHVVPQARAVDPVGGECLLGAMSQGCERLFGQRGAEIGQAPSSLPLLTLAVALLVDSYVRLPPGLFRLSTPFPRG